MRRSGTQLWRQRASEGLGTNPRARRRQTALEPKLPRLEIRVAKDVPGLVVKDGDKLVDRATWGIAMPVDTGAHVLSAEAPGDAPWSKSVDVIDGGQTVTVVLPELQPLRASAAGLQALALHIPEPLHDQPSYWTGRRILGAGMVGVGVVAAAVGGALAVDAKSKYDAAAAETSAHRHDDSVSSLGQANAATVVVSVGGALAVAGVVIWLTAPRAPLAVGADGRTLLVRGTF